MLLSASALLKDNPTPTEEEVRDALSGNLCRCLGYARPVQAVLRAAAILRGEKVEPIKQQIVQAKTSDTETNSLMRGDTASHAAQVASSAASSPPAGKVTVKIPALSPGMPAHTKVPVSPTSSDEETGSVGKALIPRNALSVVTGKSIFAGDITMRNMVYGRVLTSPHPHAVIRKIDIAHAKVLPGVLAVLTYKDVPRIPYSRIEWKQGSEPIQDRYCLDNVVRYVGDRVAVVVAETPEVADQALALINVEYDVQSPILDQRQALEAKAPCVHSEKDSKGILDAARNIAARVRSDIGDVERGFAEADQIIESEYVVPPIQQAPLERHTVIAYLDQRNVLVIRTNSQIPHHIRRTVAHILGLPLRLIRIEQPPPGGNFGARQEIGLEDLCALLALVVRRPVRMEYTRADEFRSGQARRQYVVRMKSAVKNDGTLLANQMVLLADTGAYGSHALTSPIQGASALALYPCANMRYLAEVLYTNHAPAGSYQGYELTHEFFALESHMDTIARLLKIDALELRRKNWIKAGARYPLPASVENGKESNIQVESCNLATCAQIVAEKLDWSAKRGQHKNDRYRRGVGLALAYHADFSVCAATSGATIKVNEDGSFDVFVSRSENGTNLHTLLAQIGADVLGVDVDDILIHSHDTDSMPLEASVNDVSALYAVGGAVKKAAEQVRRQLLSIAGRMLNELPEGLQIQQGVIKSQRGQQLPIAQVAAYSLFNENRQVMTSASWNAAPQIPFTFAAQGAEVEVDVETGGLRVVKIVTAVDIGHTLNPLVLEEQIEGNVSQALGMSLSEELFYDQQGNVLTTNWQDSHMFSAVEMPEMQTYLVESSVLPELLGAKSALSVPLYGVAPAIVNAVLDAVDISLYQLPLTPERILRALHAYMARQTQAAAQK
jgi:putative selenate reductase molybdopterin-binding subunit